MTASSASYSLSRLLNLARSKRTMLLPLPSTQNRGRQQAHVYPSAGRTGVTILLQCACFLCWLLLARQPAVAQTDFKTQIAPIFQARCVSCHGEGRASGHLRLDSRAGLLAGSKSGPVVVSGKPNDSRLFRVLLMDPDNEGAMPPDGPQLPSPQRDLIRAWIQEGADWPEGLTIAGPSGHNAGPAKKLTPAEALASEHTLVQQLHDRILKREQSEPPNPTKPYEVTIPNTVVSYKMVPIPAGEFIMGTPEDERGRTETEAPPHKVSVDPFWMQAHEVTWDEYRLFLFAQQANEGSHPDDMVDAISRPTKPYVEMSFGMGIHGFPAISMTQHAANKYAEWLSAKTGEFYRLPTEAEWEYACRAGSNEAYFFGGNAKDLGDYAWYAGNSGAKYQLVATKKPNQWGLYDMLGNVEEWTLDQLAPLSKDTQSNPWVKSTTQYPQVVKGGSWADGPSEVRCGVRVGSDAKWKRQDPQLPKSIWYETDAQWLGFRLVRPVKVPASDAMFAYWNSGVEH
jgi:formylglycine-generating enzyme required for sulfatase activity/mono/diheme cytochrome c family protein